MISSEETNFERIEKYWKQFLKYHPEYTGTEIPQSFYFCDNEKDANECADLVVQSVKRATSTSLRYFEKQKERFPKVEDLYIITDWFGNPKAVVEVKKVEILRFEEITSEHAYIEGEGDKSLDYWRRVHWEYYTREMKQWNEQPTEQMLIVYEQFDRIWK